MATTASSTECPLFATSMSRLGSSVSGCDTNPKRQRGPSLALRVGVTAAEICTQKRKSTRLGLFLQLAASFAAVGIAVEGQCQQGAWYEGFEGPETSWQLASGSARHRLEFHGRVRGDAHTGEGSERIRIWAGDDGDVNFAHDVGRPQLIDELLLTLWVKADRPGIQLFAEVILPRTRDPRTRRAVSAILRGTSYSLPGQWQQLRVENLPQLLTHQTWVLRANSGRPSIRARRMSSGCY